MAHVVVNRSNDPKFPDSVCGVVADGCQFSYRCDGRPDALADPKARARAYRVAEAGPDRRRRPDRRRPLLPLGRGQARRFAKRKRVGTIGGNVFYR